MTNINSIIAPYLYLFALSVVFALVQGYAEDIVLKAILIILSGIFFFMGLSIVF